MCIIVYSMCVYIYIWIHIYIHELYRNIKYPMNHLHINMNILTSCKCLKYA